MNWFFPKFNVFIVWQRQGLYGGLYCRPEGWGLYVEAWGGGGHMGGEGGEKRNDTLTRGHDAAAMTCANATN